MPMTKILGIFAILGQFLFLSLEIPRARAMEYLIFCLKPCLRYNLSSKKRFTTTKTSTLDICDLMDAPFDFLIKIARATLLQSQYTWEERIKHHTLLHARRTITLKKVRQESIPHWSLGGPIDVGLSYAYIPIGIWNTHIMPSTISQTNILVYNRSLIMGKMGISDYWVWRLLVRGCQILAIPIIYYQIQTVAIRKRHRLDAR